MNERKLDLLMNLLSHTSEIILHVEDDEVTTADFTLDDESYDFVVAAIDAAYMEHMEGRLKERP